VAGYAVTFTVVDNATKQIDAINRRIAQMRAPMERLSRQVTRFVDVSGLRKVATGFEWISKAASTVLRSLTAIIPAMGAITGAASIAGMVKMVSSYAAWSRELVAAADNIGITTQKLQQFEDATRLAGGNASDMREGLKGLHDTLADFNIGGGSMALTGQWANQLGINLRDASGQIRTAESLMPELLQKLAAMKNPADRSAASLALLGAGGEKLVETFRQSSKGGLAPYMRDMERYKDLTDEQKRSLQLFSEAQGRLGVGFDRLGQRISAMMAEHFTPMLNSFSDFVDQNTPDILAAADDIGNSFGELWKSISGDVSGKAAIKTLRDNIKAIVDDLKWLVDKGNDVADVLNRLSNIKSGADLTRPITKNDEPVTVIPGQGLPGPELRPEVKGFFNDLFDRLKNGPANIRPGYQPQSSSGGYLPGGVTPASYGTVAARQPMEFWLDMTRAISAGFEDAFNHLRDTGGAGAAGGVGAAPGVARASYTPGDRFGPAGGAPGQVGGVPPSGSGGGVGGIDAPAGTPIARTGLATVTSASGRKFQVDARFAQNFQGFINDYEKAGGQIGPDSGTLGERPNNASGHPIGAAIDINQIGRGVRSKRGVSLDPRIEDEIARRWGFVSGNSWRSNDQGHFGIESIEAARRALESSRARAPAVTMPGAKPVNGSVDVNITHKNPPPNAAVTATGSGAVNVAPPRVEYQQLGSV
jgi:hypothetical protein